MKRPSPPIRRLAAAVILATSSLFPASGGCAGGASGDAAAGPATRPTTGPAGGVAVVELFTSEGCSSCPPADAVLARLAADARDRGLAVYPLAFHVDYWDRLGWRDPYSSKANTDRQYAYAAALGAAGQVYTPQMVVNGTAAFTGSNGREADRQVAAALGRPPPAAAVAMKAEATDAGAVRVGYDVSGAPAGAVLNVAVVERGLETKVPRGENAGRTLRHENVVRAFEVIPLDKAAGSVEVKVPAGVNLKNAAVVGFVQDAKRMTVSGAAAVDLVH